MNLVRSTHSQTTIKTSFIQHFSQHTHIYLFHTLLLPHFTYLSYDVAVPKTCATFEEQLSMLVFHFKEYTSHCVWEQSCSDNRQTDRNCTSQQWRRGWHHEDNACLTADRSQHVWRGPFLSAQIGQGNLWTTLICQNEICCCILFQSICKQTSSEILYRHLKPKTLQENGSYQWRYGSKQVNIPRFPIELVGSNQGTLLSLSFIIYNLSSISVFIFLWQTIEAETATNPKRSCQDSFY